MNSNEAHRKKVARDGVIVGKVAVGNGGIIGRGLLKGHRLVTRIGSVQQGHEGVEKLGVGSVMATGEEVSTSDGVVAGEKNRLSNRTE
ncbi:hypothetical protein L2E82_20140 [Cichorium intybus]|uniref:Uncharacterized protein n=1 Tax=Cichorium intybus TaxID=13427 RepID=A0ACB9DSV3_CICIN|nr:hypothetical protein L2E82_20140 [Cichorium intybus]